MIKTVFAAAAVLAMSLSAVPAQAQSSTMPDNATRVLPEMGVLPVRPAASAPLASERPAEAASKRLRRAKPQELKLDARPELRPEMSPGMQPNSQKPLRPAP
jgi:hypothetical protein